MQNTESTPDLERLLEFVRLTHLAHNVERVARIPGTKRYANMVEHSWQLTLLAWYLIDHEKLALDTDLVLRYALVHDMVETYAGDTYFYDASAEETKHEREAAALVRLTESYPSFPELSETIARYEKREDPESRFVYALDKLIDPVNIYLEGGLLWREKGVTLDMLLSKKEDKVQLDPTVLRYFNDLKSLLVRNETHLFPTR